MHSDPHVATTDEYSRPYKYSSGGSVYGVKSHKVEDNWHCEYCGSINSEDRYYCDECRRVNKSNI